jgi:hypothetical protein
LTVLAIWNIIHIMNTELMRRLPRYAPRERYATRPPLTSEVDEFAITALDRPKFLHDFAVEHAPPFHGTPTDDQARAAIAWVCLLGLGAAVFLLAMTWP